MSFIDPKLNLGFIHVSKTSSVVEWTWRDHYGVRTDHGEQRMMVKDLWIGAAHDTAEDMGRQCPDLWRRCFKVGFVRNPWAWWVSAYYWYNPPRHNGFDFMAKYATFGDFLRHWQEWKRGFPWNGYTPFLCDHTGRIAVDHVARTERLQEEFDFICNKTGFPQQTLPTKHDRRNYREYYDPQLKDIVAKFLSPVDLTRFPYDFEDGGDCL